MTEKLKPCPFCGSKDVEIRKGFLFAGFVHCHNCAADVTFYETTILLNDSRWEECLIQKWNRRSGSK